MRLKTPCLAGQKGLRTLWLSGALWITSWPGEIREDCQSEIEIIKWKMMALQQSCRVLSWLQCSAPLKWTQMAEQHFAHVTQKHVNGGGWLTALCNYCNGALPCYTSLLEGISMYVSKEGERQQKDIMEHVKYNFDLIIQIALLRKVHSMYVLLFIFGCLIKTRTSRGIFCFQSIQPHILFVACRPGHMPSFIKDFAALTSAFFMLPSAALCQLSCIKVACNIFTNHFNWKRENKMVLVLNAASCGDQVTTSDHISAPCKYLLRPHSRH